MTNRRHDTSAKSAGAAAGGAEPWTLGRVLDFAVLFLLLALIPLRAVVGETHTFELPATFRSLDAPGTAGPATTFAITTLIFAAAGIVLTIRLARGGPQWRWTGAEPGIVLLLGGMVISTIRAGQKHLALIGSLDFLGVLVYLLVLRQLLDRPWRIRLALSVVMATGAVVVAKCAYQRCVELPETIKYYEEHRAELLAGSGEASAGFIHDYEQRLKGGAVTGYFAHPNLLASFLILVIMTSLGMLADRMRRRPAWSLIVPGMVAGGASLMLVWAQSKGAAAALGSALLLWIAGSMLRSWVSRRPRAAWAGLWLMLLVGTASLVGVLRANPGALGLSMRYRSMYWEAAARMFADQGPWGVGADNFGRFFTRYKDVACPEDVEDPHSWVMKSLCEWGAPGLAGLLLILAGISWKIARSGENPSCENPFSHAPPRESIPTKAAGNLPDASASLPVFSSIILSAAILGAICFGLWSVVIADAPPAFILLTLHIPLIAWFGVFVLGAMEVPHDRRFADDTIGLLLLAALSAGLIAFLIHSGIDLALFHGGAATAFCAMVACTLALAAHRHDCSPAGHDLHCRIAAGGSSACVRRPGTAMAVGLATTLGMPIICLVQCGSLMSLAIALNLCRKPSQSSDWDSYRAGTGYRYEQAILAYHADSTAAEELVAELTRRVSTLAQVDETMTIAREFQRRDPHNALVWNHLATLYYQRFELARRAATSQSEIRNPKSELALADLDQSIECLRNAVAAYPTSPNRRLALADLLEKKAAITGLAADRGTAADELQAALDLDAKRIYISKPHRFRVDMRNAIERRISGLRSPMHGA